MKQGKPKPSTTDHLLQAGPGIGATVGGATGALIPHHPMGRAVSGILGTGVGASTGRLPTAGRDLYRAVRPVPTQQPTKIPLYISKEASMESIIVLDAFCDELEKLSARVPKRFLLGKASVRAGGPLSEMVEGARGFKEVGRQYSSAFKAFGSTKQAPKGGSSRGIAGRASLSHKAPTVEEGLWKAKSEARKKMLRGKLRGAEANRSRRMHKGPIGRGKAGYHFYRNINTPKLRALRKKRHGFEFIRGEETVRHSPIGLTHYQRAVRKSPGYKGPR